MKDVNGVHWVDPDMSIEQLAALMRDANIAAIPIGEDDRLIGLVWLRIATLFAAIAERYDPATVTARDVMHRVVSSRR